MTTPIVTELPLRLESTTSDSFLDPAPKPAAAAGVIRELDRRQSDGIDVQLLWHQTDDHLVVTVFDAKTGHGFQLRAEPHRVLDVFHHPYAYAASHPYAYAASEDHARDCRLAI
jgi:hypothetical protein